MTDPPPEPERSRWDRARTGGFYSAKPRTLAEWTLQEQVRRAFSKYLGDGGDETATDNDLLEAPADAHARVIESLPAGVTLLVVEHGPNAGSRFLLDQDVIKVGRHPDSDIFLDDVTVSRRHMEFRREGSGFSVHDAGSILGVYVNRRFVYDATLVDGDLVHVGRFRFAYLTGPAGGPPEAPAR